MAYSDGDTLVRVVMESTSGLPEDQVVNTFSFHYPDVVDETAALFMVDLVDRFYNVEETSFLPVSEWIGESVNRAATHLMQLYKIQAGELGAPIWEIPWLGPEAPGTASNLPLECAAVASFHATLVGSSEESGATRPRARRRGRVYIGPLTTGAMADAGAAQPVVNASLTRAMRHAMAELRDNSGAPFPGSGFGWGVWSRTDAVVRRVVGGWTDNAFDTQRRRGNAATNRTAWGDS